MQESFRSHVGAGNDSLRPNPASLSSHALMSWHQVADIKALEHLLGWVVKFVRLPLQIFRGCCSLAPHASLYWWSRPARTRRDAPPKVQKYVLRQLCETLPINSEQQKAFVVSGSLAFVQQLNQSADGKLQEQIETLNSIYPPDVVEYYTPGYVCASAT